VLHCNANVQLQFPSNRRGTMHCFPVKWHHFLSAGAPPCRFLSVHTTHRNLQDALLHVMFPINYCFHHPNAEAIYDINLLIYIDIHMSRIWICSMSVLLHLMVPIYYCVMQYYCIYCIHRLTQTPVWVVSVYPGGVSPPNKIGVLLQRKIISVD